MHILAPLLCLVLLGTASSCTNLSPQRLQLSTEERRWQQLEDLIAERLLFMETAAELKDPSRMPTANTEQELERRESLVQRGIKLGLPPQWVNHFFEAQSKAAKMAQRAWFDNWNGEESLFYEKIDAGAPPSLLEELDQLDTALLDALVTIHDFLPATSERLQRMTASIWHRNPDRHFPDRAARVAVEGLRFPNTNESPSP